MFGRLIMEKLQLEHIIFEAVNENQGVTVQKLAWVISVMYDLNVEEVKKAILSLTVHSHTLGRVLNSFKLPDNRSRKKDVILLRVNKNCFAATKEIFEINQNNLKYKILELNLRNSNGRNALEKI